MRRPPTVSFRLLHSAEVGQQASPGKHLQSVEATFETATSAVAAKAAADERVARARSPGTIVRRGMLMIVSVGNKVGQTSARYIKEGTTQGPCAHEALLGDSRYDTY